MALTVQGRYGLTDRVDVGVRFFTTGTSAELRHRIYQAPEGEFPELAALVSIASGFQLASRIGCTFMCRSTSDEPIAFMSLRIPIGITVGRLEVTLAPNGRVELPDTGAWLWAGGQLAATVRLGTWKVGLEGSYLRPVPFFRPALGFESVVLAPEGHVGAVGFKTF